MVAGDGVDEHAEPAESRMPPDADLRPEEATALDAFARLSPEGSLDWAFEEALRRLDRPEHSAATLHPWGGLPDDLWERGRAARIGRRFMGDVTAALADFMATDARTAADAAVTARSELRFLAAYDALRHLAARVRALEGRLDPTGVTPSEYELPVPDATEWLDSVATWLGADPTVDGPVVVGEARDERLVAAVAGTGRLVRAVEPRGPVVWEALAREPSRPLVLGEVADELSAMEDGSAAGVVLSGCVDRLDLAAKCALLRDALRVTVAGGRVVLLVTDQTRWDEQLPAPARDLLPGRPLHPETWCLLLPRLGAATSQWHPPKGTGTVHALVAEAGR